MPLSALSFDLGYTEKSFMKSATRAPINAIPILNQTRKRVARKKSSSLFGLFVIEEKSFVRLTPGVNVIKLFTSSLMMRPNKLEHLSVETLSSQALEFEGKARANPVGAPFRCFLHGKVPGVTSNC
jgi:hypothetical protein